MKSWGWLKQNMQVELRLPEKFSTGDTDIPEWLDGDFLQLCMQNGEGDPTIRVLRHEVSLYRSPSNQHGTVMYCISVEFKRRPRSRNILDFKPQETKKIVIKVLPHPIDETDALQKQKEELFDREITALSTTIPAISKYLGIFSLSAQCFYSEKSPRALLVLDDLTENQFIQGNIGRSRGLDFNHSMLVMRSMAALHAGSIALYEKDKSSMDSYKNNLWSKASKEGVSPVKDMIDRVISCVADEVETWPNFGELYANRIRAWECTLLSKVRDAVSAKEETFNVLNHGSCWYNNILFRYDNMTTSHAQEVLFVNFGDSIFTSPVIDIQHFLYSSPTDEVRLQNFNRLIQHYHRELVSNLERMKVTTKPPTKEELIEEMDNRGFYSVLIAITLLPIILSEKPTTIDILSDPNMEKDLRKLYANEQYKVSFKRLLQIFDAKGYLN